MEAIPFGGRRDGGGGGSGGGGARALGRGGREAIGRADSGLDGERTRLRRLTDTNEGCFHDVEFPVGLMRGGGSSLAD